jgi:hypothetical protein
MRQVGDHLDGDGRRAGVVASLRRRLFGLAAVVGSGLLLVATIFVETVIAALERLLDSAALDLA